MNNVANTPLNEIEQDTWLDRAVARIKAEAASVDPAAAVARFNSAP